MKQNQNTDIALLLIRVAIGVVFLYQGVHSFIDDGNSIFVIIEIVGAIFILIGFWTGWTSIVLAIDVLITALINHNSIDLTVFLVLVAISLAGPGSYKLSSSVKKI